MTTFLWILLTAYLLVWLVMLGGLLEVVKKAQAEGKNPKRPLWMRAALLLAWPVTVPLEIGKRIGKGIDITREE